MNRIQEAMKQMGNVGKDGMWALIAVAVSVGVVWRGWLRSRRPFLEYMFLNSTRWYTAFWFRMRSNVKAPFPPPGPGILVSNHTCSADPPLLLSGTMRIISFLMAREHYHLC